MKNFDLRPKLQCLMNGTTLKAWHCIQIKQGRRWLFLGDENGIMKFETREARDAKIEELGKEGK